MTVWEYLDKHWIIGTGLGAFAIFAVMCCVEVLANASAKRGGK